jgi:hypothetical protein
MRPVVVGGVGDVRRDVERRASCPGVSGGVLVPLPPRALGGRVLTQGPRPRPPPISPRHQHPRPQRQRPRVVRGRAGAQAQAHPPHQQQTRHARQPQLQGQFLISIQGHTQFKRN